MSKSKCHSCDVVDSLHENDINKSCLLQTYGSKDDKGIILHYIYCKNCNIVNVYKPRFLRSMKFIELKSSEEVAAELLRLMATEDDSVPLVSPEKLRFYRQRMLQAISDVTSSKS